MNRRAFRRATCLELLECVWRDEPLEIPGGDFQRFPGSVGAGSEAGEEKNEGEASRAMAARFASNYFQQLVTVSVPVIPRLPISVTVKLPHFESDDWPPAVVGAAVAV